MHGEPPDILVVEVDLAVLAAGEPDDHVEGGGLAGAVRAEETDHFAALDLERQVLEYLAGFVAFGEIKRPQDAHGLEGGGVMMMCTRCEPCSAASATMLCA